MQKGDLLRRLGETLVAAVRDGPDAFILRFTREVLVPTRALLSAARRDAGGAELGGAAGNTTLPMVNGDCAHKPPPAPPALTNVVSEFSAKIWGEPFSAPPGADRIAALYGRIWYVDYHPLWRLGHTILERD